MTSRGAIIRSDGSLRQIVMASNLQLLLAQVEAGEALVALDGADEAAELDLYCHEYEFREGRIQRRAGQPAPYGRVIPVGLRRGP